MLPSILTHSTITLQTASLAIRTSGLLVEQFLALHLGFEDAEMGTHILKVGDTIKNTTCAFVLEYLIGQLLYKKC